MLRCEVFFSDTWSCICLLFTYRRDCGAAGVLVTRFGIRWIEDDVALSGWRLRKKPRQSFGSSLFSDVFFVV